MVRRDALFKLHIFVSSKSTRRISDLSLLGLQLKDDSLAISGEKRAFSFHHVPPSAFRKQVAVLVAAV